MPIDFTLFRPILKARGTIFEVRGAETKKNFFLIDLYEVESNQINFLL